MLHCTLPFPAIFIVVKRRVTAASDLLTLVEVMLSRLLIKNIFTGALLNRPDRRFPSRIGCCFVHGWPDQ